MGRDLPQEDAMKAAIDYCIKHGVLQDFLETNSSEVFNMPLTEWDTEEAKEVWFEEGIEVGLKRGHEEGREEGREEIARNALVQGFSFDTIRDITGLDVERIKSLASVQ